MIIKIKDQLILENIVNKIKFITPRMYPELTCVILDSCISIINVLLHNLHGETMLVLVEVDVLMILIGN